MILAVDIGNTTVSFGVLRGKRVLEVYTVDRAPGVRACQEEIEAAIGIEQLKKMEFDIIIVGKQAIDGDTAQVGPEIAELLSIPQICYVRHIEISEDGKSIIAHRETDEGYEVVKAKMPVLLTATKGLNEPRLPNIMGIMKAKKKPLEVVDAASLGVSEDVLGLKGSPTTVRKVFAPDKRAGGVKVEADDPAAVAKQLVEYLAKKGAL